MGSSKQRWKIYFHKSPSHNKKEIHVPKEFLCPISSTLMLDPVIVSSGHTFERNCVEACKALLSTPPVLPDGSVPNFSAIIPNLALKSAILNWCQTNSTFIPKPIDFDKAKKLAFEYMTRRQLSELTTSSEESVTATTGVAVTDTTPLATRRQLTSELTPSFEKSVTAAVTVTDTKPLVTGRITSSEESVTVTSRVTVTDTRIVSLPTRPSCYSSSSSCELDSVNASSLEQEEEEFLSRLRSSELLEQGDGLVLLRKITRTQEESRARLCTPRILATLKSLTVSKYMSIQVNSVAVLVNLSLDRQNKVKIVRYGIVPHLIDVLKGGFLESRDHAAGALFSLAIEDQNKTAIGVLGGLQPLLHSLRSESERTRHDSALALYHLTLVQSNRAKLVKLGGVPSLLGMVRSGQMTNLVLLVLCNLATSPEGRAAMLDDDAVECFLGMLNKDEFDSESTKETCVTALYGLSQGGLRFRAMAKEAGAEELLRNLKEMGSKRLVGKVRKMLEVLTEKDEDYEEVDWEELLNSEDDTSQNR